MKYITLSLVTLLFITPTLALAQAGGLVPCGGSAEDPCTTKDVIALVAQLVDFLITMLGVIAVIALVYAGFKMVVSRGNESEWKQAKAIFTNVVIGIIIILASWLIVDTVMRGLTGDGLQYWSSELSDVSDPEDCRDTGHCTGGRF